MSISNFIIFFFHFFVATFNAAYIYCVYKQIMRFFTKYIRVYSIDFKRKILFFFVRINILEIEFQIGN